jgi:hypothetical protein
MEFKIRENAKGAQTIEKIEGRWTEIYWRYRVENQTNNEERLAQQLKMEKISLDINELRKPKRHLKKSNAGREPPESGARFANSAGIGGELPPDSR